jgi:DNA-binding transcriptional regulator/RsmH inhibitor MraZ
MEPVNAFNAQLDSKNRLMAPANALEINTKLKVFVVMLLSVKMEPTI